MKNSLRIGEFARLCDTTRETLLHYDRKDIIKPKRIADNGYRYYALEQFWEFKLVSLLKETGSSLAEINSARKACDSKVYLGFIRKKMDDLSLWQQEVAMRLDMLSQLLTLTEESLSTPLDAPFLVKCDPKTVRCVAVSPEKFARYLDNPEVFADCMKMDLEIGNKLYPPLGLIVPEREARQGSLQIGEIFYACHDFTDENTRTLPGGNYLAMFHRGTSQSHKECFTKLVERIYLDGYGVAGDVLIYDQMNYLLESDNSNFMGKYMIPLK